MSETRGMSRVLHFAGQNDYIKQDGIQPSVLPFFVLFGFRSSSSVIGLKSLTTEQDEQDGTREIRIGNPVAADLGSYKKAKRSEYV